MVFIPDCVSFIISIITSYWRNCFIKLFRFLISTLSTSIFKKYYMLCFISFFYPSWWCIIFIKLNMSYWFETTMAIKLIITCETV
nr:MAG TPA: hypothetical protein [Caudoviricetes sp.]